MTDLPFALSLRFSPLVPMEALAGFGILCAVFALAGLATSRGWALGLRICAALAFLGVLANPVLVEETRSAAPDVAVVVVDRSTSNAGAERKNRTDAAEAHLRQAFGPLKGVELRVVEAPAEGTQVRRTDLFDPLASALTDVPESRRAGVIFLTDGQVHDVPAQAGSMKGFGPVHAILTGRRNEKDRAVILTHAPAYGVVGQAVTVRYKIGDHGHGLPDTADVLIRRNGAPPEMQLVPSGIEQTLTFEITQAGQNVLEIETPVQDGEISPANNRTALIVNGVRDRLRVLLVSGTPHAGERVWRDILTADPGVDLVHFTILRNPDVIDLTPQREMSLIAFPFQELFEEKLDGFDLIILDRYRQNDIMPDVYFANIAAYVRKGGGLLVSSGPEYAGTESLAGTSLRDVIPGKPSASVDETPFLPTLTPSGRLHPVTSGLRHETGSRWGRWMRVVGLQALPPQARVLLQAGEDPRAAPVLVMAREGKGRVVHMASDQIWLWARGFDGGGPYAGLMRRIVHWLMKEPDLEEDALELNVDGMTLDVRRRAMEADAARSVTLTGPDGSARLLALSEDGPGQTHARLTVDIPGVWRAEAGPLSRVVVAGDPNAPEQKDIRSGPERLEGIVKASNGSLRWTEEDPTPSLRLVPPNRTASGKGWIGLRRNDGYTVAGVRVRPLLVPFASLGILMTLVLAAWWREGRKTA